ncbi:WD40 repeat-like protein, partial [Rhizoctonia solani]
MDPPSAMPPNSPTHTSEQSQCWIAAPEINISHVKADPECKVSGQIFVDEDVVCSLPWIESTVPLKWSGLLPWSAPLSSEITLRVCRSVKHKSRHYYFPPFSIPDVDESGELTLALSEARWSATIRFLTSKAVEHSFPSALEKLNLLEDEHEALNPEATEKGLFKHVLQFTRFATEPLAQALSEPTIKMSLVIVMNTWELLDRQAQLDEGIKSILQSLICIRDVNDMTHRFSSSALASAIGSSEEPIRCILGLLEQISIYMHNQLSMNNLVCIPTDKEEHGDTDNIDEDLARLKDLAVSFRDSWMPMGASQDTNNPVYNDQPDITNQDTYAEATIPDRADSFGMLNHGASSAIDPHEILDLLRPAEPSGYDPDQACLDGTREAILATLIKWTQTRHTSESLMWISGQVGMGKTAIATSLCQRLHNAQTLAGSFFCRHDGESNNPLQLFNNLIHAIAIRCAPYALEVTKAIRLDRGLCTSHLGIRYEYLVKRPLQRLSSLSISAPLVLVIDGLDQCGSDKDSLGTLEKLDEMSRLVSWLKVVVTARPVITIQEYFENNCLHKSVLHLQDYDASPDIRAYIEDQFAALARKERWAEGAIDRLHSMSCGVFLWASTVVEYIRSSRISSLPRLKKILNNQRSPVTEYFDTLYASTLGAAIENDEDEVKEALLRCVGAIIAISEREPLAMPDLEYLMIVAGSVDRLILEQIVKSLGPLLHTKDDNRIRFYHPSFKDFITTPSRSGPFCIQLSQYDAEPTVCCLRIMHRDLRFNICGLETSHLLNSEVPDLQDRIEAYIGPALKYACTHWIDHFITSFNQTAVDEVRKLLEGPKLLYWIEVMSLFNCVDKAIRGIARLMSLELNQFDSCGQVLLWIRDLHRFLLSFYDAISTSTPHIYVSALAFAPSGSLTAQRMRPHFPNTLSVSQTKDSPWHPCVRSTFYPQPVQCLSISPDGSMAITGHPDGSLHMRDALVGTPIGSPLVGHTGSVTCVAHSPSSHLAASGSHDATVRIWDLKDQNRVRSHALTGHSGSVNSVAFCCSTNILASGSSDRTIRLWDTDCMRQIGEPYTGHSDSVTSIMFSPNGNKLVSGSSDRTIRVWSVDIVDQKLSLSPLVIAGHSDSITCVAVSPDGTKIASGSIDRTVRLWSSTTGNAIQYTTSQVQHHARISCVRFSPCGKLFVSSSLDGVIQLHSSKWMRPMAYAFHHAESVNVVEFLPNGLYAISGSSDATTRLWEINQLPGAVLSLVGHSASVMTIAVSKDGTRIISGASEPDNTVRIWDIQTGTQIGCPLAGHSYIVRGVAISPDGTRIVSGAHDRMLILWDTATHTAIHSYEHTSEIWSVAFSPDGTLIAFGSSDSKVYVFEVAGWEVPGTCLGDNSGGYIFSIAFSPNGTTIASGSSDSAIALWNIATRDGSLATHSGPRCPAWSVAFSQCGTQLAFAASYHAVRVWDIQARSRIRVLMGHTSQVMSVAFSHDGSYIASGADDATVRLWNAVTGEPIGQPFTEHTGWVQAVAFSPNHNYLISGSDDKTIRVQKLCRSYTATEQVDHTPHGFPWPENPYDLSSHVRYSGWMTSDQQSFTFWLPPHHREPGQFLRSPADGQYPQTFIDYLNFAHGAEWTNVASEAIRTRTE